MIRDMGDIALKRALNGDPRVSVPEAIDRGLPPPPKHAPKQIPLEVILYWKVEKRLTNKETAKQLGCSERNIAKRIEGLGLGNLQHFKDTQADYLAVLRKMVLTGITTGKIKKAKVGELTKAHKELHEAERLERGEATALVGYADLVKLRKQKEKELEDLEKRTGKRGVKLLPEGLI